MPKCNIFLKDSNEVFLSLISVKSNAYKTNIKNPFGKKII